MEDVALSSVERNSGGGDEEIDAREVPSSDEESHFGLLLCEKMIRGMGLRWSRG
jgi:hypothetical protein